MKYKSHNLKKLSLLVTAASLIFTTACQNNSSSVESNPNGNTAAQTEAQKQSLQKLLTEESGSIALADLLASAILSDNPELLKRAGEEKQQPANAAVAETLKNEVTRLKKEFLFQNSSLTGNEPMIEGFLTSSANMGNVFNQSLISQAQLSVAVHAQNQALDRIMDAYNQNAKVLAKAQAAELVKKMSPQSVKRLDALKGKAIPKKEKLQEIRDVLQEWSQHYKGYSTDEAVKEIMLTYICEEIEKFLSENESVQEIIKFAHKVQDAEKKLKEFQATAAAIKASVQELRANFNEFADAATDFKQSLKKAENVKAISNSADLVQFANDALLKNQTKDTIKQDIRKDTQRLEQSAATGTAPSDSFLSKKIEINKNAVRVFESAERTANQVDSIIKASTRLATALDVQIPPEVQNAIGRAQEITKGVKLASQITKALSTGGVMGAVSLLAGDGGVAADLLGGLGGGSQDGTSVALAEINSRLDRIETKLGFMDRKLDAIMESQRIMTGMIKDVAVMMDLQHREVMTAIADMQQHVFTIEKMTKLDLDSGIISCEQLTRKTFNRFEDSSDGDSTTAGISFDNALTQRFDQDFRKLFFNRQSIVTNFVSGYKTETLNGCHKQLDKIFGNKGLAQALYPISRDFNYDEPEIMKNGLKFKEVFARAKAAAEVNERLVQGQAARLLHLPAMNLTSQKFKARKMDDLPQAFANKKQSYDLSFPFFPLALQRYSNQLLLVYPLVGVQLEVLKEQNGISDLVTDYLQSQTDGERAAKVYLTNALYYVQSAIAQESLIAGEMILDRVILQRRNDWMDVAKDNPLMMTNILMASLAQQKKQDADFVQKYENAMEKKDVDSLSALTGLKVSASSDSSHIKANLCNDTNECVEVVLPSPEVLRNETILYSDNMQPLLRLQDQLTEALALEQANKTLSASDKAQFLNVLFIKNKAVKSQPTSW